MSTTDIKSMFESIKASLSSEKTSNNSSFRNILKLEAGKTYLVRLIPNINDPKSTFFHYSHHGFTSLATGQYIDATCPRTFGERCPICEARFKLYKTKKEEDKNLAYTIRAHDKHMVNVYVVSDPTNSENEGTCKILRFGKRIYDKILDATEGDDADEFGPRVYDLTENGCNFKIKVETAVDGKNKFINYNNSRFTAACAIPNMDSDKIKEIYENIFDLTKILETKTEDELNDILKNHIFCNPNASIQKTSAPTKTDKNTDKDNSGDKDDSDDSNDSVPPVTPPKQNKTTKNTTSSDQKIQSLLDGLDNL